MSTGDENEIEEEEEEEDDQPEKHNRLHRRDTPHHLKNKRVHLVNSKEAQEKVTVRVCLFILSLLQK